MPSVRKPNPEADLVQALPTIKVLRPDPEANRKLAQVAYASAILQTLRWGPLSRSALWEVASQVSPGGKPHPAAFSNILQNLRYAGKILYSRDSGLYSLLPKDSSQ